MKRKSSDATPANHDVSCPEIPHDGLKGFRALLMIAIRKILSTICKILLTCFVIVCILIVYANQDMREIPQQKRTTQRVVEQMRPEFDTKPEPLEKDGHELHVPVPSKSAQTDSVSGESSEELKLRLERLESLILQMVEKPVVAECRTPTESGNQLEQVNLRLDRIEALLSHPLVEDNHPKRPTASPSHDNPTPTDGAAMPWNGIPLSGVILAALIGCGLGAAKVYAEHKKEIQAAKEAAQEEEDKRRCTGEALAERLTVEFGSGSRPVDSDKKSDSEDENSDSFENMELPH